jgi:hypothetical protein
LKTIIRAKGGSRERVVEVNDIRIPDLWVLLHNHDVEVTPKQRAAILEVWHLCHDLLRVVKETP